ncbi:type I-B CRISPR-associated endonuclease Cas1b [Tindallia californiensis]|uniref:CRISPR-associated endonuclease Cas1 n=1 Tax=Tindallia californiensis TaxID=159292 RepID=A0A1H3PPU7_9FIRM|nr:type I-B CRISPR-associated endonuclease Cas1b [Tindallia californiensis]SDZ02971.1 CRISP-associated protein Cas1 [Tindallia californiensis]
MKKTIYIFSDGELKRKDNTLYYQCHEKKRFLPVEDIKEIMVFGDISFNKQFLELLSQKEILLHYFNYYGYYTGTFYPREHMNSGYMILKQASFYSEEEKRLELAKCFVEGAYKNILQVLKYYRNRGREIEDLITEIQSYYDEQQERCEDINQLMSLEGHTRERYYKAFDSIIQNKDFVFQERSKRPPRNELNTLISFGNTVFYTAVLSEIYKTHLDPRIGFLHATNFRRFSLNLDVAEVFKPIIIDRIIFTIIGKKMITRKDFGKEAGGLYLNERGKRVFIEEFDKRMDTTIQHKELNRKVSYRRLIRMELYKIQKHLMEEEIYQPFVARW